MRIGTHSSSFSFNNVNNWNTNSNVSSHLCDFSELRRPCFLAKHNHNTRALVPLMENRTCNTEHMKRVGGLFEKICTIENLRLADEHARKGKAYQHGVQRHKPNADDNLYHLQQLLLSKTYTTSPYTFFKIYEPKEREIARLPYFPDRITHHAVMNILEPIFIARFTADTYSCIKGRGIHGAAFNLRRALRDEECTRYFANFYLTGFDHWMKELRGVKHYFRYADDLVILSGSKEYLHQLLIDIKNYLATHLQLSVKSNHQVFPVAARSIDFVGYRFYHSHTLLRKSIKQRFARMLKRYRNEASIASYNGWIKHCDGKHLLKTLLTENERMYA